MEPCRRYFILFLVFLPLLFFPELQFAREVTPTMRALIIAVSDYKGGDYDWAKLHSYNDAEIIKTTLDSIGFKGNVTLLKDPECTRNGIINAIRNLKNNAHSGDVVVIHYSGHGVQLEAEKDHRQTDNLDECWVPSDASIPREISATKTNGFVPYQKDFERQKKTYIRGWEIANLIDSLRLKLGPEGDLLILVDACCSAGSTHGARGLGYGTNRGLDRPIVSENFTYHQNSNKVLFQDLAANKNKDSMCNYVMIAAARAQESDIEYTDPSSHKDFGPLSYAFATALSNLKSSKITYTELYESIRLAMNKYSKDQLPQIEGDCLSCNILGGQDVGRKKYFRIKSWDNDHLTIDAGKVHGITSGSRITVYPLSWLSNPLTSPQLTEGTVEFADLFHSTIKLDTTIKFQAAVAVLKSLNTDNIQGVSLKVVSDSAADVDRVRHHFNKNLFVKFDETPDLILTPARNNEWDLKIKNGELYCDHIHLDNDQTMLRIDSAITSYARYIYLQNLEFADSNVHVKVELCRLRRDGKPDSIQFTQSNMAGELSFDTGTRVAIRVINDGKVPAYVNLVDMQPNGKITTFLPHTRPGYASDYPVYKCVLPPRAENLFYEKGIPVSPPFGNEIIKVFVTKDELDLENVIKSNGARGTAGTLNNLGKVFQKSYKVTSRGLDDDADSNVSLDSGTVYSIIFEITDPAKRITSGNN